MSITRAWDVTYVRFTTPDLEAMRRFLLDFGMVDISDREDRVVMRGYDGEPFLHMTERGEPGFAGFGIEMTSLADLDALAAHDGTTVEPLDAPGGGKVVRLTDPDGMIVEAVAGRAATEVLATSDPVPWNHAGAYLRKSQARRVADRPSHVRRLGHVVLNVSDFRVSEAWYKERFGFITSDEIQLSPDQALGAFMRADRGDVPSDHHTLFLMSTPVLPPGFMHSAFEVLDLDDLMAGHEYLKVAGHTHQWGVGRHQLGSQVFDYWRDPIGNEIEHWTDGDQFIAADGGGIATMEEAARQQWGMPMPPFEGGEQFNAPPRSPGAER